MIAGDGFEASGESELCTVSELELCSGDAGAASMLVREETIKSDPPKADNHAKVSKQSDFLVEPGSAVAQFLRSGFVAGRSATSNGGDPDVLQLHAILQRTCNGLGGESGVVKNGIKEVARTIAREGTASPVGAVGSGGKAESKNAGFRVAEGGNWSTPVLLIDIGTTADTGDLTAVCAKARAALAADDLRIQLFESAGRMGHPFLGYNVR